MRYRRTEDSSWIARNESEGVRRQERCSGPAGVYRRSEQDDPGLTDRWREAGTGGGNGEEQAVQVLRVRSGNPERITYRHEDRSRRNQQSCWKEGIQARAGTASAIPQRMVPKHKRFIRRARIAGRDARFSTTSLPCVEKKARQSFA